MRCKCLKNIIITNNKIEIYLLFSHDMKNFNFLMTSIYVKTIPILMIEMDSFRFGYRMETSDIDIELFLIILKVILEIDILHFITIANSNPLRSHSNLHAG